MKKILTLAIALVMVFAIAAPAFASGWDIEIEEKELKDITITIDALSWDPVSSSLVGGSAGYKVLEKTYPVVKETPVRAFVTVTIPKEENLSDDMISYLEGDVSKVFLKIETSNLTNVKVYENGATTEGRKKVLFTDADMGQTFTYMITGEAVDSYKDAKITAKFGVYNEWENGVFTFEKNGKVYTVTHTTDLFTVKSSSGAQVSFPTKDSANGAIDTTKYIVVDCNACDAGKIVKQVNNILAFEGVYDGVVYTVGTYYEALKAAMDEIFGVLGFDYEGAKYMQEAHFTQFFGTVMEGTAGLTYPAGAVTEFVTDDPSVNPPQTGDNASVVGFVMIAVALVAAAAVTVKKVRA